MFDFHIHTGQDFLATEAINMAIHLGYRAIGLIARGDGHPGSLHAVRKKNEDLGLHLGLTVLTGVELVQIPPALIGQAVAEARERGAQLVLVHGETLKEPVERGTNLAAIAAGADIVVHPGLIDDQAVELAAKKGVALELSSAAGHSLTNAHVLKMAFKHNCPLLPGSNASLAERMVRPEVWPKICQGAGEANAYSYMLQWGTDLLNRNFLKHQSRFI